MISDLKKVGPKIAAEKGIYWGDTLKNKFLRLDKDVESGALTKEKAIAMAAAELKIEKSYDKHMEELKRAIR